MQNEQELKKGHSAQHKLRICETYAICATCETCKLFCKTPTSGHNYVAICYRKLVYFFYCIVTYHGFFWDIR